MTLFIACMLIYGFKLPGFLYAVATVLWVMKVSVVVLKAIADKT